VPGLALLLIQAVALCWPLAAVAVTFNDLYTVSIEPDPSLSGDRQRNDAIQRGMVELLTRITGRPRSATEPNLAALIRSAPNYYNAYTPLPGEIRISFLRNPINDALAQLNEPIWPDERPLTLLWFAVDFGDGQRAELQAAPGSSGYRPAAGSWQASEALAGDALQLFELAADELLDVAEERGLPLVLPRLDAQDRRLVRFADVWGGFDRFVERAGERYGADAILIARLQLSDNGSELHWLIRRDDAVEEFASGDLRGGMDRLADQFAAEFTIAGDTRETWLTIRNIWTWPDYARVDEFLRSVSIVDDVFVRSWSTDGALRLRVDARGDASRLQQILALGGTLVPWNADGSIAPVASDPNELVFVPEWLRNLPARAELP